MSNVWKPLRHLLLNSDESIVLMLLNGPDSSLPRTVLEHLWNNAALVASVDGATNALHKVTSSDSGSRFLPDLITGDFDSVDPSVLQFYKEKGSKVIHTPDQTFTDFTKCLEIVGKEIEKKQIVATSIVVLSSLGGRLDHTLSNVNTLYLASDFTQLPVYLYGSDTVCCLLKQGKHTIDVTSGCEGTWCGLVPVGEPCQHITTTGLKWNLSDQEMRFGGLISTSNELAGDDKVTVETDHPLLWIQNFAIKS